VKLDDTSDLLPLSSAMFYILVSLADGERNGAAITREVEELTGGQITMPPGTLYRLIKQLVSERWIEEAGVDDDDQRRRYYRLTPRGRKIACREAERLEDLVRVSRARRLLPASSRV
jgi:DNA-binding PadR family transcriptional regulator